LLFVFPIFYSHAQTIQDSQNISITAVVPDSNTTGGGGGSSGGGSGGGGGGSSGASDTSQANTKASFRGFAYPGSIVVLLKNGLTAVEVPASPDGSFSILLANLVQGTYNFGIRAEDTEGRKSTLQVYTVFVTTGITTEVAGIFLPPTVSIDKKEVRRGDILNVLGRTLPNGQVNVIFNSLNEITKKISADKSGIWHYKLDTNELEFGDHLTKARAVTTDDISPFSQILRFKVGTQNTPFSSDQQVGSRFDLNKDGRVNIVDFSILAYWYNRSKPPALVDLNEDGRVNLIDFSILVYHWTG
jgi:hypothetical protein